MKRFKMDSIKLQALFDSLKESISKDDSRPPLRYIKMEVKENTLTAVSVDGYMLSSFETAVMNEDEDFEFLIKPFYIPKTKLASEITFTKEKGVVTVNIKDQISKNVLSYEFNDLIDSDRYINWRNVLKPTSKNLEVCVDPNLLIRVLKQFTKNNGLSHNEVVISFEENDAGLNPIAPIHLTQKTKIGINKEAIVLPIKRID